jgi:polysaccharide export outer membrane protein
VVQKDFFGACFSMAFFRRPQRGMTFCTTALALGLSVLAAGCSTLPSSGPTGSEIRSAAKRADIPLPFTIVEVDTAAEIPAPIPTPVPMLTAPPAVAPDTIGPGDLLNVTIYEAGVSLFGNSAPRTGTAPATFDASANAERLPPVRVDDNGLIRVPFAGSIRAAGRTTAELQSMIRSRLQGMSQNPQVLVSVAEAINNTVIVSGEVARAGRLPLMTNRESLTDVLALAGGHRGEAKDLVARIDRDGHSFQIRLADLADVPNRDIPIGPGDRITLLSKPQTFSVLGAPNRAEEIRFPRTRVNLTQAIALAGGVNPNLGDAAAVFVFRYEMQPDGIERPVVYHLNMMRAGAYFLSQRFMMRDQDLVYIGNAQANQPTKFVQLLSQLFVPVTTVRATVAQ